MKTAKNKPLRLVFAAIIALVISGAFSWWLTSRASETQPDTTQKEPSSKTEPKDKSKPPNIKSSDDLAPANKYLKDMDIDSQFDTSELDAVFGS